jgi:hypothetical protein
MFYPTSSDKYLGFCYLCCESHANQGRKSFVDLISLNKADNSTTLGGNLFAQKLIKIQSWEMVKMGCKILKN